MPSYVNSSGKVRLSQVVLNYGIGSIIDFPDGSFMPLGLDFIDIRYNQLPSNAAKQSVIIYEPRLQKYLDVDEFRRPSVPPDSEISDY